MVQVGMRLYNGMFLMLMVMAVSCSYVYSSGLEDAIYRKWSTPMPCTRWMNSTTQIGCSSASCSNEGAHGILWLIDSTEALSALSKSRPHTKLIVALSGALLTPTTIGTLEKIKEVKGLVVLEEITRPTPYSEVGPFPQSDANTNGESPSYNWNVKDYDLLHHNYKWPMWLLDASDSLDIHAMATSNAIKGTRFGARLRQFMYGFKDSATCLRYKYCEPVGGHSVWGVLPYPASSLGSQSAYVATVSSLDAISIFAGRATGADADISGLVANIAALATLAGVNCIGQPNPPGYLPIDPKKFSKSILWSFFEGEHWGYAGSTRFLHDWSNFLCHTWNSDHTTCENPSYPAVEFTQLNTQKITALIEMKQVGSPFANKKFFVHRNNYTAPEPDVSKMMQFFGQNSRSGTSTRAASSANPGLPPSSTFSYIAAAGPQSTLALNTVVFADHDSHYSNMFYGSRFDDASNINVTLVADAASILTRTLFALAMGLDRTRWSQADHLQVNSTMVAGLVDCLTTNLACPLFASLVPELAATKFVQPAFYPGPYFDYSISVISKVTHDLMIMALRDVSQDQYLQVCKSDSDCPSAANTRCVIGKCINSSYVQYHDSYSTGFTRAANGDWKVTDPDLPNWVEPYWDNPTFETFVMTNPLKDGLFLTYALLQIPGIFVLIYFVKKFFSKRYDLV